MLPLLDHVQLAVDAWQQCLLGAEGLIWAGLVSSMCYSEEGEGLQLAMRLYV
jgi:hypothetical protein